MNSKYVNEYNILALRIKEKLELEKSPVAVKLFLNEQDIPQEIQKIEENLRHCEMVQRAVQGEIFYSTSKEQQLCNDVMVQEQ